MNLQESGKVREIVQYTIDNDRFPIRWDISDGKGNDFCVFDSGPKSEKELSQLRAAAIAEFSEQMDEIGLKPEDLIELPMPSEASPPDWDRVFASNARKG